MSEIYKLPQGLMIAVFKEARSSFAGLRVDVLKLKSGIEDKLPFPSYYIVISTYDQSQVFHQFLSNNCYHSNVSPNPLVSIIIDYLEI